MNMSKVLTATQVKAIKTQLITREQRKAKGQKVQTFANIAEKFNTAVATIVWIADGKCHADVKVKGFDALVEARNARLHTRKSKVVKLKQKTSKKIKLHTRKPKKVLLLGAPKRADYSQWLAKMSKEKKLIKKALMLIEQMETEATTPKKRGRPRKDAVAATPAKKRGRPKKVAAKKRGRPRKDAVAATPAKKRGRPKKVAATPAKKRGRPRKDAVAATPAKKRGRPRKDAAVAAVPAKKRGRPRKDAGTPAKKRGRPRKEVAMLPTTTIAVVPTSIDTVVPPSSAVPPSAPMPAVAAAIADEATAMVE